MRHATLLPLALAVTLALAALGACTDEPPAAPTAEQFFRRELCASCHGGAGEGSWMGPPLRELAEHWEREALAEFLREPKSFIGEDERLAELMRKFPNPMVGNRVLGKAERLQVADWLLGL